jgi:hypothetical protein
MTESSIEQQNSREVYMPCGTQYQTHAHEKMQDYVAPEKRLCRESLITELWTDNSTECWRILKELN